MNQTSESSFLKTTRVIHGALVFGLVIFLFTTLLLQDFKLPALRSDIGPLQIAGVLLFIVIPVTRFVADKQIKTIKKESSLDQKKNVIQTSMIIKWSGIEGFSLFSIVIFLVETDTRFFIIGLFGIILLFINGITMDKLRSMKVFSDEELRQLA